MDLKSFQKSHQSNGTNKAETSKDNLRKTAETYAQKSDSELLAEILQAADRAKRDGSVTSEDLQRFAQNLSPMLSEEQRGRLQNVLNLINRN